MAEYADYISFKDGKQYTILNSSVSINEAFEMNLNENKSSKELYVQPSTQILPLVDSSADEFNSSILAYNNRKNIWTYKFSSDCTLYIVYRHQPPKGISSIWIGELDLSNNLIRNAEPLLISSFTNYEDPRMFAFRGELYISYSQWGTEEINDYNDPRSIIQIAFTHIIKREISFELGKTYIPPYGNNFIVGKTEKNWGFFESKGELYCLYSISPFTIFKYDIVSNSCKFVRCVKTIANLSLRGGTPPIYIKNRLISFIHCNDYLVYMLEISCDKNVFKISHISEFSTISSLNTLLKDNEQIVKNGILFPCGLVYDTIKKHYIVSMGYNDKVTAISYIKG